MAAAVFRVRVMAVVTGATAAIVGTGAVLLRSFERGVTGTDIRTFRDAVRWVMETITTVGYGDHHPFTAEGRLVATGLMVAGIAMVGVLTAAVVTWFFAELEWVHDVRELEEAEEKTEATLETVLLELRELNERARPPRAHRRRECRRGSRQGVTPW